MVVLKDFDFFSHGSKIKPNIITLFFKLAFVRTLYTCKIEAFTF